MEYLLFSGTHPRHLWVQRQVATRLDVTGIVFMEREEMIPPPDPAATSHDRALHNRHFERRAMVEEAAYGQLSPEDVGDGFPTLTVPSDELNSTQVATFVADRDPDACFIFGVDIIREPVMSQLPNWRLNLHLGLSPWYRGSATLFWPFYFLQPQFAGATLHQITPTPDAGAIVHHTRPTLRPGQGVHEVAANVVRASRSDILELLTRLSEEGTLPTRPQQSDGKLFLTKDYEPHHLRVIYDLFDNDIVDAWLKGELGDRTPHLVDALE